MRTREILVGVDGTVAATRAVRWAAREAIRRGASLRIVHVLDADWQTAGGCLDPARQAADVLTADAAREARAAEPAVSLRTETLLGDPAPRLLAAAGEAALLVLGHRGRGGFARLLLGSVCRPVAMHATCPVAVVRGRGDAGDGPVAAGVDDSPAAQDVLAAAFQAAADRGAALVVVRTYLPPLPLWVAGVPVTDLPTPQADADERTRVEDLVAPWREKFPAVPVEVLVSHAGAASVLVEFSHRAQLVVIGSHGHGLVAGALLGSTGRHLLHHADCPVLIMRPDHVDREKDPS